MVFIYCFFILGLEIKDAIYPKNTAAAIPPALALSPPVNAPINPFSLTASIVPFAKLYPNRSDYISKLLKG